MEQNFFSPVNIKITPVSHWIDDFVSPLIIAGPCSAESEEQVLQTAHLLAKEKAVRIFRAGIWKPRTRPGKFAGVGEIGLSWLAKVKQQTRLLTAIEVANKEHVALAKSYGIDVLWVGARTTANPFAIEEISDAVAKSNLPVIIKNPINVDLPLWIGAIERFTMKGINKIIAVHRGFSSYEKSQYRHDPFWRIPMELKELIPTLPLLCDPSHIAGRRDYITEICQKSIDKGMDGLMIEAHYRPESALSDSLQQITPNNLKEILNNLVYKKEFEEDRDFTQKLKILRKRIDLIDREIIDALQMRMNIVDEIGRAKQQKKITAFQLNRLQKLMEERIKMGKKANLPSKYIREVFQIIHEESVKRQSTL